MRKHIKFLNRAEKEDKSRKVGSLPYIWKHISKNVGAMFGIYLILFILIMSLLSPFLLGYDEASVDMTLKNATPSLSHLFGCDYLGRDILSRVFYGARYTLSIGVGAVIISASIGILLGAVAGYFGGMVDAVLMRFLDIFQSFPGLLLALILVAVFGTGLDKCILAVGIAGAPGLARMMRANILSIRSSEYIEAATSINCPVSRIIFKHLFPNAVSPLIVQISMAIASAGLEAASLSFLGMGIQEPKPEWGAMISSARNSIREAPHTVLFPGIFIMLTVLGLNLIGDAIRDALDPKLRD